ncbi:MAG: hypothetical protein IJ349_00110 [Clostridia bacterium]|nr:hypothetical protein [Clostridia bacterium]
MSEYRWLKVDTASIMFTSLSSKKWGRTFRTAVILKDEVNPDILKKAAADVMTRFPSMHTAVKKGFFWNYLEGTELLPEIREEFSRQLLPITMRNDGRPDFRLTYYKNRLAMESAHHMGDGLGTSKYFNALVERYVELKNNPDAPYNPTPIDPEELSNAFNDYYEPGGSTDVEKEFRAHRIEGEIEKGFIQFIFALMDVDELHKAAKDKGLTITEYLASALILGTLRHANRPVTEPVIIAIPVNLRRFFPTETVRNFTIQSRIDFFPEGRTDWSFDEICEKVKGQLSKRLTVPELQKILNNFGSLANNKVIRFVPNFIKLPVVKLKQAQGHGNNTTILTNTGKNDLSPILEGEVLRADGINGDTSGYGLISTCSALSCNGVFNLCFSICAHDTSWARECVRVITEQGIRVRIESTHGNGEE